MNIKMDEEIIWIASFDIGKINFSFYIEEINIKQLNLKNIEKNQRYNQNGTCTDDFSKLLKQIYGNGKLILLKNVNLTSGTNKNKYFDIELCHNLVDILDEYREYWDKVSIFIVEQQMSFGKKVNTMALKLGQHTESYFIFNYGRFKKVVEFPAFYKTQVLGCEKTEKKLKNGKTSYKNIDKYARKKWSVEKVFSVLAERDDFDTMSEISSMKKQDDVADVIIQLQSFKYLYFIEKMKF
jgi:hypothetical protein